jgi:hypothetical protein
MYCKNRIVIKEMYYSEVMERSPMDAGDNDLLFYSFLAPVVYVSVTQSVCHWQRLVCDQLLEFV